MSYEEAKNKINTQDFNEFENYLIMFCFYHINKRLEVEHKIQKVLDYIDSQSPDSGVSGHHIKKILKGEEKQ